ncbi:GLPGLI family protein [Flavobacterium gelidilacus]|uniref:GLPGLI family protein n=1 Tax=Flavobacterium gelidilacus TaxID=206041 RepID=UPI0004112A6B|nr:GLPGLI family protein [Flavobacterium gelidilacus]
MKNLLIVLFSFIITNVLSQNFQGIAYYSSQTQIKDFNISGEGITPDIKEKMMEKMKKAFEKNYILTFTNFESVYAEEEKLDAPNPSGNRISMGYSGGNNSKYYKNFKNKQFINNNDIFGKEFLITDSLEKFDWKITEEQKKIGNYTCNKAQIIIPVTEEDIEEYEEFKKKQEENKTSFMTISEPKDEIIEAWYTMEIPVSNGPREFWGLPGLILELHDGNTTLLCSKIVINPKEKIEIKAPKNGKKVTQKEFNKIQEDKMNSMMNENGAIEIKMN